MVKNYIVLLQSATSVHVSTANAPAVDHLMVGGYDVSGEVRSEGEPMKEVTFLLYSATVRKEVHFLKLNCQTMLCVERSKQFTFIYITAY